MNYVEERINTISTKANELYHTDKTSKEQKKLIRDIYSEITKLKSDLENEFEAIEDFERDLY